MIQLRSAIKCHTIVAFYGNAVNESLGENGKIVISKEIRRILRIQKGEPSCTTLTSFGLFLQGIIDFAQRITGK